MFSGRAETIPASWSIFQPIPVLMRELVLDPVGMSHSSHEQPLPPERLAAAAAGHRGGGLAVRGKRHTYPEMAAAGLWTTPSDLARFAIAIQRTVRGDDGALLDKETAEARCNHRSKWRVGTL